MDLAGKIAKFLFTLQRFRKDCVRARFHVLLRPINCPIEILNRARICPRDDHEIGITSRCYRRFDFFRHLLNIDERFSGKMSAALGEFLVLNMTTGQTYCFQVADCARNIFRTSKPGIHVDDCRDLHRFRNVPGQLDHFR